LNVVLLSCTDDGLLKFQIRYTTVISGLAVNGFDRLAYRDIRGADQPRGVDVFIGLRIGEDKGGPSCRQHQNCAGDISG
jgi:hypothetical protein